MDILFCKNYIINLLDQEPKFVLTKLRELITKITEYKEHEDKIEDTQNLLRRVISNYEKKYLLLLSKYEIASELKLEDKVNLVQEILVVLSILVTQLVKLTGSDSVASYRNNQFHEVRKDLYEKLENFKSEKITWVSTLKTLNLQLEDRVIRNKIELHKNNY